MQHNVGPRRRRVAVDPAGRLVTLAIRLTDQASRLVEELRRPGVLVEDGCSLGDVLAQALVSFNAGRIRPEDRPRPPTQQGRRRPPPSPEQESS